MYCVHVGCSEQNTRVSFRIAFEEKYTSAVWFSVALPQNVQKLVCFIPIIFSSPLSQPFLISDLSSLSLLPYQRLCKIELISELVAIFTLDEDCTISTFFLACAIFVSV